MPRPSELETIQRYLNSQKAHANVVASIQSKLDAYRQEGIDATTGNRREQNAKQAALLAEKHHPTKTLALHMKAACNPQPCPSHSPHHIVPGRGYTVQAYKARVHLHLHGLRINDPDNGVWLPKSKKVTPLWSMPQALAHKQYHTHKYEEVVHARVTSWDESGGIRRELRFIAKLLQSNKLQVNPEVYDDNLSR